MRRMLCIAAVLVVSLPARAQTTYSSGSEAFQIATAVMPLPQEFRDSATVLGYRDGSEVLEPLRQTDGPFVCLAASPGREDFHVACYQRDLEPFMQRGRTLRAEGRGTEADAIRNREIESGELPMPVMASLYSITIPRDRVNPETGEMHDARGLFVIYVPFATPESTGISSRPSRDMPWLMDPGTPRAHIMFSLTH
jgi:hypothetical protein